MRPAIPPTYLICATQRSGSTLLCKALLSTGNLGKPDEFFDPGTMLELARRWQTVGPREYLDRLWRSRSTPNGALGIKVMYPDLEAFLSLSLCAAGPALGPAEVAQVVTHEFPGVRHVWIKRRDRIGQAVSYWRAIQTERWTSHDRPSSGSPPAYSFECIAALCDYIVECDRQWDAYFTALGQTPHVVHYEDLAGDYRGTVAGVVQYLGLTRPTAVHPPQMAKQADELSGQWARRFAMDLNQLRGRSCVSPPI